MADPKKQLDKPKVEEPQDRKKDGTRETIESIVIAFIFAFLFRTFEAEAFVIPTGSMAPTLLGRHKDETCPQCKFAFTIGASEELNQADNTLRTRIDSAVCPNCRHRFSVRDDPVFIGDRILVTKFSYEVSDPDRWDVTVFKFPEDPSTNYIKRLCGLPGETIEIRQGDLHRVRDGEMEILRKQTAAKQQAVLQTVYDDDHPSRALLEAGWPERWAGVDRDDAASDQTVAGWSPSAESWKTDGKERTYRVEAGADPRWLRYRHFVPTAADWRDVENGRVDAEARLILDFCSYNAVLPTDRLDEGLYWVGDLAVAATVNVEAVQAGGKLVLELVEGSRKYRCALDPGVGVATLSYVDALDREQREAAAQILSKADVEFDGPGEYDVVFANVDDRLWLWIDGDAVEFDTPAYEPYGGQTIQIPTADDLTPAGISAENLTATVSHLHVARDVYYRAEFIDPAAAALPENHRGGAYVHEAEGSEEKLYAAASEPDVYADLYIRAAPWLRPDRGAQYQLTLGEDEFLLLGDNSPRSLDGRLWGNIRGDVHRHAVPRNALVGKALLIFWPHGLRLGNEDEHGTPHGWTIRGLDRFFYHRRPDGSIVADYPAHGVPFYPNFERIFDRIR